MNTLDYRKGTEEDIPMIMKIIKEAIVHMEEQGIFMWNEEYPTVDDISQDISKQDLYVAMQDEEIIAFYVLNTECNEDYFQADWKYDSDTTCILHRLCVSPAVQHQGVGRRMMEHIEAQAVNEGYRSMRLDVFDGNPGAQKLYASRGFELRGDAHMFGMHFLFMEKSLVK